MRVLKSFLFALRGLKDCFLHEKNFQIQFIINLLVVGAGFFFSISATEWISVLLCCAVVLSLEILNSAIEKLCNLVCPTFNLTIRKVKDMSAGAVLLAAILSVVIGCIIFIPKIISMLS
ncbi:MAG TPA: diacylglycerol kinase family protein [Hanamia sp.]|nr:diacylglycerol kinase family protein [Hanamia sp.]